MMMKKDYLRKILSNIYLFSPLRHQKNFFDFVVVLFLVVKGFVVVVEEVVEEGLGLFLLLLVSKEKDKIIKFNK